MSNQSPTMENSVFRIIFSNIKCKIKLSDQSLFSLVVRIGKTSSRYTTKRQLRNYHIQFDQTLQVPFDQKILLNQNTKREKCQIMLYKFRINRQKQTKQLVGMASIAIVSDMFDEDIKKIRLTNSFDKQAFVQCRLKIQHGEADILSQNQSRLSSFFVKSQAPSFNDIQQLRYQLQSNGNLHRSQVKQNLGKADPQYVFLNSAAQQLKASENGYLPYTHVKQIKQNANKNLRNSKQQIEHQTQEPFRFISSRQQSQKSSVQLINNYKEIQQKHSLLQICSNLQNQNSVLMNKIENLEHHIFKGKQDHQNQYSIYSQQQNQDGLTGLPRSQQNRKRSPMIKKNLKINIAPTGSQLYSKQSVSTDMPVQIDNQRKNLINKPEQPVQQAQNPFVTLRNAFQMESIKQSDHQYSPFFSKKNIQPRLSYQGESMNYLNQNLETSSPLTCTFAGDRYRSKIHALEIKPVMEVSYKPPVYHPMGSEDMSNQQQVINKSMSPTQQHHSKSYSRFDGKKKFQLVGAIKNPDQSKLWYFDQESHSKANQQIPQRQRRFTPYQKQSYQTQGDNILHLLKQTDIKYDYEININNKPKDSFIQKENVALKKRVTLQQLDNQTQTKFRKNQRILKIANQQLIKENIKFKKQRKQLQKELSLKKQLTQTEFSQLKTQVQYLKVQADQYLQQIQKNQTKFNELTTKYDIIEKQNAKLKKSLKQQKQQYDYYFRISNINDEKQKQKEFYQILDSNPTINKGSRKQSSEKDSTHQFSLIPIKKISSLQKIPKREPSQQHTGRTMNDTSKIFYDTVSNPGQKPERQQRQSKAISMLKNHQKGNIPKPVQNSGYNSLTSSNNKTGSVQPSPFAGLGFFQMFTGGLSGTGQTIVNNPFSKPNNTTSK